MKLSRDGWGGLAVLALSAVLFGMSLGIPDNPLVPIGPGFYPRIVLAISGALGLWMLVGDLLARKARPAPSQGPRLDYTAVALQFAVFGLYVGALPFLGFRIATFLFVCASNAMMDPPAGGRGWARVVLLGVITAGATWIIFERYLSVLMPRGLWTRF